MDQAKIIELDQKFFEFDDKKVSNFENKTTHNKYIHIEFSNMELDF